jgi:hypothetical protein
MVYFRYSFVLCTRCASLLYQLAFCTEVLLSCPTNTPAVPGALERIKPLPFGIFDSDFRPTFQRTLFLSGVLKS